MTTPGRADTTADTGPASWAAPSPVPAPGSGGLREVDVTGGTPRFDPARLRAHRLAAGLTQDRLAARVGVVTARIGDWERGRFRPTPASLTRLAAALGTSPAELQTPTDIPTLAELRGNAGLTQRQLADRAGLTPGAYAYLELGATTLHRLAAGALAAALGLDPDTVAAAHARAAATRRRTEPRP